MLFAINLLPLMASTAGAGAASQAASELDRLLRQREYLELESALQTSQNLSRQDRAFFRAVLANRTNHIDQSIRQLQALIPQLSKSGRTDRATIALHTLGDDYLKSFRYADAQKTYADLLLHFGTSMSPAERDEVQSTEAVLQLLGNAPPQTVQVRAPSTIRSRTNKLGLIELPVQVGKNSDFWVLDTSANFSYVTETVARRFGLRASSGTASAHGISGVRMSLRTAVIPELRLGRATVCNVVVMVVPDEALYFAPLQWQLHMLLGRPVLSALGRITFHADGRFSVEKSSKAKPVRSNLLMEEFPLVVVKHNGKELLFAFDTGASQSILNPKYYYLFQSEFAGRPLDPQTVAGGGGSQTQLVYHLSQVTLSLGGASVTVPDVAVVTSSFPSGVSNFYGTIGQNVLRLFRRYTVDFHSMRFTAETAGNTGERKADSPHP